MKMIYYLFSGMFFLLSCNAVSQKIVLTPSMVLNESTIGDATQLVDEQDLAGDPDAGTGGAVTKAWQTGYNAIYLPAHATIDLGAVYNISKIYLYDGSGYGAVTISSGTPFNWVDQFTDSLKSYLHWNGHFQTFQTRYIRVTSTSNSNIVPYEIVIYGAIQPGNPDVPPVTVVPTLPKMDYFIGTNAFIDDPIEKMKVVGAVREYHNWNWDEGNENYGVAGTYPGYPNNLNKWSPSYPSSFWDFDTYYNNYKKNGIMSFPCVQQSVSWLTANSGDKPIGPGKDPLKPASYVEHADHMFQYAARFGSVAVADNLLKLAPGQPRNAGLNSLTYFEDWNEQDAWWAGRAAYFSPYEYAAMASADYDGHLGTMGNTVGIKNADPNAKMVMGGIAKLDLNYIKSMKFWSDFNRNGSFPADVINLHHYCNDGGEQGAGTVGVSPETDSLKYKMKVFVDYRNTYLHGKEVWITEFGYDTHPTSVQRAPAIGANSQQEVQAQWLIRSYLALAAAGVDKAFMFMIRDAGTSSTQFSTSGLTVGKDPWTPKISWYYVYTLRKRLAGMRYESEPVSGNANVMVYKFSNTTNNTAAYAVWCPSSSDAKVPNYELSIPAGLSASLVILSEGDTMGISAPLTVTGGKVAINVSERPVFVMTEPAITTNVLDKHQKHDNAKIYPNASDGLFVIEVGPEIESVTILDLYGKEIQSFQLVSSGGRININISSSPAGVYIVKFVGKNGVFTKEIVKR
jgi:hypothetical protein